MKTVVSAIQALDAQQHKIIAYLDTINNELLNNYQRCDFINGMLSQLELLCQFHFMEEERLMDEMASPAAAEHKHLNNMFLVAIDQLKTEHNQCHSPAVVTDFKQLRDDLAGHMQSEKIVYSTLMNDNAPEDSASVAP